MRAGNAQHVLGDGAAGVEGGVRHALEDPLRFSFLFFAHFKSPTYASTLLIMLDDKHGACDEF